MPKKHAHPTLSDELSTIQLGDERRNQRAKQIVDRLGEDPGASFPELFDDAELEATYRFLNNSSVDLASLLAPHTDSTVKRAQQASGVLVVHDTTLFEFSGEKGRQGLTPLRGKKGKPGFLAHFALAVADDGTKRPLGVLGVVPIVRKPWTKARKAMTEAQRRKAPDSEYRRWAELVAHADAKLGKKRAIHVMDREGDNYELLAQMASSGFVVRLKSDRKVSIDGELAKVSQALGGAKIACKREVRLSRRLKRANSPSANKCNPPRAARTALLEISSRAIELMRPHHADRSLPASLKVNLVRVQELDAPEDAEPVDWILLTSEPIKTAAQVERIVDIYRWRWLIEEFFQALKTGCKYESRQLESKEALFSALGLFIPVAWRLLLLRSTARHLPDVPATAVLTKTQIEVLRAVSKKRLPSKLTARDALMAVGKLGGHIKNNGEPGWRVLGRGYEKLQAYEIGWIAARKRPMSSKSRNSLNNCDQ